MQVLRRLWRVALAGKDQSQIPVVEGALIALGAGFLQQGVLHNGLLVGAAGVGVIAAAIFLASIIGLGKPAAKWAVYTVFTLLLIGFTEQFPMPLWQRVLAILIPMLMLLIALQKLPQMLERTTTHRL